MSDNALPESARVVIIGGGIIGCSVAYHLAEAGCDVVLLERDQLTSGTTWHAAGLLTTFGSGSETLLDIRKHAKSLYARLEEETGLQTGFVQCGFIELAADEDRLEEYRRISAFNRFHGKDIHELSPSEIKNLFPFAETDDLKAGFYAEDDGRINPVDVTMAMARGARLKGAKLFEKIPVESILTAKGAVAGVRTAQGDIRAEFVVNCAGMWARQLGEQNGVVIPNQAAEHYYLITEAIDGFTSELPVLEDPSKYAYYREETGGLMIGLFEAECKPWQVDGIPDHFSFGELEPDWERLTPFLELAMERIPIAREAGIRKFFCGPESFTPDLAPVMGEAPELNNYFVAAGLNSVGIITGGGYGRVIAHWILNGKPDVDVTGFNIDRFQAYQCNPEYRRQRALESLGLVYACHYPDRQPATCRGAKRSPFHERLDAQRAHFRDVSGWECPGWYAPQGQTPDQGPLTFGKPAWFEHWAAEHHACRNDVIAMDMSFMGKFLVQGRDAGAFLNYLSANEVDGECNQITYTQWLNDDGMLEADLTVVKLDWDRFMVVTSDVAHRHTEAWMRRHVGDRHVFITDVTSSYGQLNIQGPKSRDLLQALTSVDLSNDAFPFRTAKEIDIGLGRLYCVRITYAGELGYELYIPSEQALHVYDRIVSAGESFGLRHAGLKSLASLRLEKGYRDYGHDIDNMDDPYSVGLGFAVRLDKEGDFIGKEACAARKAELTYPHRMVSIVLKDAEPILDHQEIVCRNGTPVGTVRAGSFGHTLGASVGLAMVEADVAGSSVDAAWLRDGEWTVRIADREYAADVSLRPFYDPNMERVRA
ncbi:MAG: FAD-dependent oxidoreductase [Pseudomonadota bacterium]